MVLEMMENQNLSIVLGRDFLKADKAKINVFDSGLTLRFLMVDSP